MTTGGLRRGAALGTPAFAALVLYLQSFRNGFVRDDIPLIVENTLLRAPGGLGRLLTGDFLASAGYTSGLWRPLPLLSFWLEGRIGGWLPFLFHASNVVLHAGTALLVGLLLTQAGLPRVAALLGALWFAAMPAHVEPAAWISGRTDLLCGAFALASLWLDRRARETGKRWPGWAPLTAFGLALLSKEAAAGWAGVILAAELARSRQTPTGGRELARWVAPYLAITTAWLMLHWLAAGPSALPDYVDAALRARRQAAAWVLLPQYLAFLWPWYPHASDVPVALPAGTLTVPVVAGAALTVAAFALAVGLAVRRSRWAVPCAIVLVPVMPSLVVALARGFITSGERMIYLPSAGAAWLAANALAPALGRRGAARWTALAGGVALVLVSAVETVRLQPMWLNNETVFRAMIERQPDNPAGWVGLAEVLAWSDRKNEAVMALSRAATLAPRLPAVHLGRAELHYRYGEWNQVIADAGRALELDNQLVRARILRASTLVRLGRTAEAAGDIERLLRDQPGNPSVLLVEGQRLLAQGRAAEAIAPLEGASRGRSDDPALWFALGAAHAKVGDLAAARRALERTVALAPLMPAGWGRLGAVCAALGDSQTAATAFEHARRLGAGAPGPARP